MTQSPLSLLAPDPRQHDDLFDLVAKVFSHHGYWNFRNRCRDHYIDHSFYDWKASRVGYLDGRLVAHFGVWDYQMRLGAGRVRCGGIGAVATHGDYRKRGLMDQTARASVQAMRELGYDMSMLFGIDNYYDRFGYVSAWKESTYTVRAMDFPREKPAVRLKTFPLRSRPDLSELYNRQNADATGTAVRPTFENSGLQSEREGYLWADGRGRAVGYVLVSRSGATMEHHESAGDLQQILRILAMLARKHQCQDVRFGSVPFQSDLGKWIRRGNYRCETSRRKNGGPMIRVINLSTTLAKMEAELSRRMKQSPLADYRGALTLVGDGETAVLAIDRSRVRLAAATGKAGGKNKVVGGPRLAQLLLGSDDPAEVVEAGKMKLTGDAPRLVAALFPDQHPTLAGWDHY